MYDTIFEVKTHNPSFVVINKCSIDSKQLKCFTIWWQSTNVNDTSSHWKLSNLEMNPPESKQCWKHEKEISITKNKQEIRNHIPFYYVLWVLKPNNDISGFHEFILYVISLLGHLLVWSQFFVPIFLGPLWCYP